MTRSEAAIKEIGMRSLYHPLRLAVRCEISLDLDVMTPLAYLASLHITLESKVG